MPRADIESFEALRDLRVALLKFAAGAQSALSEAIGQLARAHRWLDQEQSMFWQQQIRLRREKLEEANRLLRHKKLRSPRDVAAPSAVEEERALIAAQRAVEEAYKKAKLVKRWLPQLEKESLTFRGATAGLIHAAEADVPRAVAALDRMLDSLEAYTTIDTSADQSTTTSFAQPSEELPETHRESPPSTDESQETDTADHHPNPPESQP